MDQTTQPNRRAYLDRIARVTAHIHQNLDDPLDLDALADVACLSRFHWHRIYRAMTGETAAQTVRRLRLARAATALAQSDQSIEAIARSAGYSSQAAFSRAFAADYHLPPAAFRGGGTHVALVQANEEKNAMAFPMEIRNFEDRPVVGVRHTGPYTDIGATFGALFVSLEQQGLMENVSGCMGIYWDDPDSVAQAELKSCASVFVEGARPEVKAPLEVLDVRGGDYAVLHYVGPYTAMKPAYDWLYGVWLPASGREAADAPALEINLNTPDTTPPAELITEICLPLEG